MINEQLVKREIAHIWQSMFPEPYNALFLDSSEKLQLRVGNRTIKIKKKELNMSLDDFSERIIIPAINQYIRELKLDATR